jgi:hypothetical protein
MLLLSQALAMVVVDDPTACVARERLENELTLLMGARGDDLTVTVFVTGDGSIRRTRTEVRDGRPLVWSGRLEVTDEDCDALAEALALTVKSGLGSLPGWSWDRPRRRTDRSWIVALRSSATWPPTADFDVSAGPDVRVWGPVGGWIHGRVSTSLPVRVGIGRATQTGVALAGGLQLTRGRSRTWIGASSGVVWAVGQGYPDNLVSRLSRLQLEGGVGARIGGAAWGAVHTTVPIVRRTLTAPGGSQTESPVYMGLSVGLRLDGGKRSRSSEGRAAQRASWSR